MFNILSVHIYSIRVVSCWAHPNPALERKISRIGPRPTRMSPVVRWEGAKGPRSRERANRRRRDLRGSDWRKKREREMRMEEREMEMKMSGLLRGWG